MGKKDTKRSAAGEIQVFELTMDNPENQEVLNRRLRKVCEPDPCTSAEAADAAQGKRTAKSSNRRRQ